MKTYTEDGSVQFCLQFEKSRWSLLMGRFDMQETGILDSTHLKFYTKESAIKMFNDRGFSIAKVIPSGLYMQRFGNKIVFEIIRRILFAFPNLFSEQYIFIFK